MIKEFLTLLLALYVQSIYSRGINYIGNILDER